MKAHDNPKPIPFGFTLLELLVVIAILALLAALAFPVGARMRASGDRAECLNNVRSIANGYLAYAADNNGRYPATGEYRDGKWSKFWPELLLEGSYLDMPGKEEYLRSRASFKSRRKVLWCPSEEDHHGIADYGPSDNVVPHTKTVLPLVRVERPAQTVLISEARRKLGDEFAGSWWLKSADWIRQAPAPPEGGSPVPARHPGGLHVGFCDGHVEQISEKRAEKEAKTLFTGPYAAP